MQKREQFLFSGGSDDQNNVIYLPFNVARKLKPNADDIYILAVAKPGMMDEAKDQVRDLLARAPPGAVSAPDNFGMETVGKYSRQLSFNHCGSGDRDGGDFVGRADGRRHRRDEHHAGVGY